MPTKKAWGLPVLQPDGVYLVRKPGKGDAPSCLHFQSLGTHKVCKAGVAYADVQVLHDPPAEYRYTAKPGRAANYKAGKSLPCLPGYNCAGAACAKAEYLTEEEEAAEFDSLMKMAGRATVAIAAVKEQYQRDGKFSGELNPCPACGAGPLRYGVAGCNGHTRGNCPDCKVSWIE